ncbi:MAG: GTPase Era [Ferruginibacter sp.]|nr:GTPase Era [Ferruginibacter sp.]
MKSGFVNIFGKPNAGKSTLLNALIGEKLAIVSHKVQTTRHRIKGILSTKEYQIIFSDTPGIIEPKYKLHEKMMAAVKGSLEDADIALLITDINEQPEESHQIFTALKLKVPSIVVLNKADKVSEDQQKLVVDFYRKQAYCKDIVILSALKKSGIDFLLKSIIKLLPEGQPFYEGDDLSDMPTKFFVGEMVREKIFQFFGDEIPYHTTVLVQEFTQKTTLIKIRAEIIVQRDTQKGIILGEGGSMIKKIGTAARKDIEEFLGSKIFLELFVKVRPKWRDNELHLREYGY